jgi:hypothetical protein
MSGYFIDGSRIYECKTCPGQMGEALNDLTLKKWTRNLTSLLTNKQPSAFRYVFPVNRISFENKEILNKLQQQFLNIDIEYFDCDEVEELIKQLNKVNNLPELVDYIQKARDLAVK